MSWRGILAVAAAAALAAAAGCGSTAPADAGPAATVPATPPHPAHGPAAYVAAVGRALAPPAEMARLAAAQGRARASAAPRRADLDQLVARAEGERTALARLRLGSAALDRQRDRLVTAYDGVVATMKTAVEPVSEGRRIESRRVAFELLERLRELPSAAG